MPRGAGVCPECGFAFRSAESKKPAMVDGPGQLVEIDAGANQRMRAGWQRLCDEEYVEGYRAMNRWVHDHVPFPGAAFAQNR